MEQETRVKQPDEMYCQSCGALIKKGAQFCPHCGTRMGSGSVDAQADRETAPGQAAAPARTAPVSAEEFNNKGQRLVVEGKLDEALAAFGEAILAAPRYVNAYLNRAEVLERLERHAEAQADRQTARALIAAAESGRPHLTAGAPAPVQARDVGGQPRPRAVAVAFSSSHVLAQWVMGALVLTMIMAFAAVVSGLMEVQLISQMINGEFVTLGEAEANDNRQAVVGALQAVPLIATAVLFLVWIHRAHRNLPALNASGLKYSPGWAVGGWFIPIMNLWRPYQVTEEIWKASDPERIDPEGQTWQTAPVSPLLGWWWAFWIIGGVIGWFLLRFVFQEPEDLELLRVQSLAEVAADAMGIVTAVLAMLVVGHIDARQEEKNRRLQGVSLSGSAPLST